MRHFSIYFWKICAYLNRSISITIQLWRTSFITRLRLISFNSFWYYNNIYLLRHNFLSPLCHICQLLNIFLKRDTNKGSINTVWALFGKMCPPWQQICVKSVEAVIQICSLRYGPLKSRHILEEFLKRSHLSVMLWAPDLGFY